MKKERTAMIYKLILLQILLVYFSADAFLWKSRCKKAFDATHLDSTVAEDKLFQRWLKRSKHPLALDAKDLAAQLTWREIQVLDGYGGIHAIETGRGCPHKCLGCNLRCDVIHGDVQHIRWENYKIMLARLVGLQAFFNSLRSNRYRRILRVPVASYYYSEPMNTVMTSTLSGTKGIVDALKYFHDISRRQMYIWTAGWNPQNPVLQENAQRLVLDLSKGEAPYLSELKFEIKPFTIAFEAYVQKAMRPIVEADADFQERYGHEWRVYGFDFSKYSVPAYVYLEYERLVLKHMNELIEGSTFLQDRISNMRTLAPGVRKFSKAQIVFYKAEVIVGGALPYAVLPFLRKADVFKDLILSRLTSSLPANKTPTHCWDFNLTYRQVPNELLYPRAVIATFKGTIQFSRDNGRIFDEAAAKEEEIRGLTRRQVLFDTNTPPWRVAESFFRGSHKTTLTEAEKKSIIDHIRATNPKFAQSVIKVRDSANYIVSRHVKFPVVFVKIDKQLYSFDLTTGEISKNK